MFEVISLYDVFPHREKVVELSTQLNHLMGCPENEGLFSKGYLLNACTDGNNILCTDN